MLLPAASAQAAFGTQRRLGRAGQHPGRRALELHLSFDHHGDEDIKNLVTELPPGLVGNPQSAGFCVPTQLSAGTCPANSVIGNAQSNVTATLPISVWSPCR